MSQPWNEIQGGEAGWLGMHRRLAALRPRAAGGWGWGWASRVQGEKQRMNRQTEVRRKSKGRSLSGSPPSGSAHHSRL